MFGPDELAEARNRGYTLAAPGKDSICRQQRAWLRPELSPTMPVMDSPFVSNGMEMSCHI